MPVYFIQMMGDKSELNYVIRHLLMYAVNFTSEGGEIHIITYQYDQQVMDRGVGIQAEKLPLIFEWFYRVDKARSSETDGSSPRLTVTRKIVEMDGRHIWVKSFLGQGSTFHIANPLIAAG